LRYNRFVRSETAAFLLDLNRQFYQTFARQFSETRRRLQPGVIKILENVSAEAKILDLGCGNGQLAQALFKSGFCGLYTGIDFSAGLLKEIADHRALDKPSREKASANPRAKFLERNLAFPGWENDLPADSYDLVFAFAVLHHLPGEALRLRLVKTVHSLLSPRGRFIHSNWQFLNSPRLCNRIHPWEEVNLSAEDVDGADYLIDWRHGGAGLRYVHHFSLEELSALANQAQFSIQESFWSDGENAKTALYQIWQRLGALRAIQ
jgi:SAM-dependent methyltransferase